MTSYPDVELGLLAWLPTLQLPGGLVIGPDDVGTETPVDLDEHLGPIGTGRGVFVQVELLTGNDDRVTDYSSYEINVFGRLRSVVVPVSEAIRDGLTVYSPVVGGVILDNVYTEVRPRSLPWDGENTRRRGATYQITVRRTAPGE